MIKESIQGALNKQVNAELYSAYLYYSMANYFESLSLGGMANWLRIQALEEMTHANKFVSYINERGGRVQLTEIEAPQVEWDSPLAAFEGVYEHEVIVTGLINGLVDLAFKESDHGTYNFLQWFVGEQVEEEATADEMVNKMKLVADDTSGLFMLDRDMASRVFTAPAGTPGAK